MSSDQQIVSRAEEFLQLFKKGAEFTQELLRENERLRFRILEMEQSSAVLPARSGEVTDQNPRLLERIRELEQEKEEILSRIRQIEKENSDFVRRYLDVEHENNNLANLYVASYQLHSTLDFSEVIQILSEVIINLIGAESFAVMLVDDTDGLLYPVLSEGMDFELPRIPIGEGVVGMAALSGEHFFADDISISSGSLDAPLVTVPLKIKERVIGVLAVTRFLMQKNTIAPVDYELFTMLAAQASTAIFSARLYTLSASKLNTIKGFLNALTAE